MSFHLQTKWLFVWIPLQSPRVYLTRFHTIDYLKKNDKYLYTVFMSSIFLLFSPYFCQLQENVFHESHFQDGFCWGAAGGVNIWLASINCRACKSNNIEEKDCYGDYGFCEFFLRYLCWFQQKNMILQMQLNMYL